MAHKIKCLTCNAISPAKYSWSFPGLQRFVCPSCKTVHVFGLSRFTKTLYLLFVVLLGYAIFVGVAQPGLLLFIVGYAFYKDYVVKNSLPTAEVIEDL